jgi:putative ABC transport system substrate-binding protein
MNRREFVAAFGGAVAWPAVARAEDRVRRIGILMNFTSGDTVEEARLSTLLDALRSLGWIDGRNIHVETRWGEGNAERVRKDVAELVAFSPDVIFATTTPAVTLLERTTKVLSIVFASVIDPVGSGLVASMSRPGGNATGFVSFEYSLAAKWLELLKEIAPGVTRAAVLRDTAGGTGVGLFAAIQAVGRAGVELSVINLDDPTEMEQQIAAFAREPNGGLIVTASIFTANHGAMIADAATRNKLPAIYPFRYFVNVGGLFSYGPTLYDEYRVAAGYIDRILKGERPADLPVQAPTRYELVINLKTAKSLSIAVPQSLLARADEVIE